MSKIPKNLPGDPGVELTITVEKDAWIVWGDSYLVKTPPVQTDKGWSYTIMKKPYLKDEPADPITFMPNDFYSDEDLGIHIDEQKKDAEGYVQDVSPQG